MRKALINQHFLLKKYHQLIEIFPHVNNVNNQIKFISTLVYKGSLPKWGKGITVFLNIFRDMVGAFTGLEPARVW